MYDVSFFFGAAAGGFVLMAAVGIQAAVALFSSIPLARRKKAENASFNIRRAFCRVAQVAVVTILLCGVVTALVLHFGSTAVISGYGLGFILAFILDLKRMSPNNQQNQASFETAYADCWPPSAVNPDDAPASAETGGAAEDGPSREV